MNEVIDMLREVNEEVSCALELPEEDDLVIIEEELLVALPPDLRMYLLEASDVVYGALEPVTVADPHSHTHLPEVAAEAWSIGLSRELIPICAYKGGYYHIAEDSEVGYWSPDHPVDEDSDEHWQDFWQWAEQVWLES